MDIIETGDFTADLQRHFWETARLKFVRDLIALTMPSPGTVMDIGCGDCFVLQSLAQLFPETNFIGIDTALTEEMISRIIQRKNHCKNISLYRELDRENTIKQDLFLLLDVLEHVENETEFLHNLRNCMHQESKIIITVPAFQTLFTDHDRNLKHFRRYNCRQLRQVLKRSGFEVMYSGYIFCSLLPFRILQKLFCIKTSARENLRAGNRFVNAAAAAILKADAAIAFRLSRWNIYIPGLSCFAAASLKKEK